jgi:hypothetical protein
MMKEEPDSGDGMMTEAEMTYLTSMEEVKIISHKLVVAEKSFSLVRDRIEKLVAKYEALLVKIEEGDSESVAASSAITYQSSYYSSYYECSDEEDLERDKLARRAQRAELRAELAAREALLAKQEARIVREEKEHELQAIHLKLAELQSESSTAFSQREHSMVLARAITGKGSGRPSPRAPRISKSKIDDVKQRFRDRTAAKMGESSRSGSETESSYSPSPGKSSLYRMSGDAPRIQEGSPRDLNDLYRTVGEEMFQHLDFYERSLRAVESTRGN